MNADENRKKLAEEVNRIYQEATPAETSEEKKKKHGETWVLHPASKGSDTDKVVEKRGFMSLE